MLPVGPVVIDAIPVGPVSPVGPVTIDCAPVGPVLPVGPVFPVGPVLPCAPTATSVVWRCDKVASRIPSVNTAADAFVTYTLMTTLVTYVWAGTYNVFVYC